MLSVELKNVLGQSGLDQIGTLCSVRDAATHDPTGYRCSGVPHRLLQPADCLFVSLRVADDVDNSASYHTCNVAA